MNKFDCTLHNDRIKWVKVSIKIHMDGHSTLGTHWHWPHRTTLSPSNINMGQRKHTYIWQSTPPHTTLHITPYTWVRTFLRFCHQDLWRVEDMKRKLPLWLGNSSSSDD